MDVREKLRLLGVRKGVRHLQVPPLHPARGPGIEQVIPGRLVENENGRFFLAHQAYPLDYQHGAWPLGAALERSLGDLSALARDESVAQLDLSRALFLDTETTGLAGGTGTYAFLVGIGYFQGDAFHLEQFFMRDYGDEAAMLAELSRALGRPAGLVSFNGRGFDWPLLESRFIMARWSPPAGLPHLDLLHVARRVWRTRLPSCSLSSLEAHILGVQRSEEDVPGWLVPQIYFQYLRDRDARPLRRVFYHNAQDILSLVTLAAHLGQVARNPFESGLTCGEDFYSLGRLFESSGEVEAAISAYERALACPISREVRERAVFRLALLRKRLGSREQAVQLWRSALGSGHLYPYVELAKYYEHYVRDYREAARLVGEALKVARSIPFADERRRQRVIAELEHRLRRVQRKLGAGGDS